VLFRSLPATAHLLPQRVQALQLVVVVRLGVGQQDQIVHSGRLLGILQGSRDAHKGQEAKLGTQNKCSAAAGMRSRDLRH